MELIYKQASLCYSTDLAMNLCLIMLYTAKCVTLRGIHRQLNKEESANYTDVINVRMSASSTWHDCGAPTIIWTLIVQTNAYMRTLISNLDIQTLNCLSVLLWSKLVQIIEVALYSQLLLLRSYIFGSDLVGSFSSMWRPVHWTGLWPRHRMSTVQLANWCMWSFQRNLLKEEESTTAII